MVGLKNGHISQKILPKMVNPRDIAGKTQKKNVNIDFNSSNIYTWALSGMIFSVSPFLPRRLSLVLVCEFKLPLVLEICSLCAWPFLDICV